ncbi:vesicle transport protein GOT1B isoform X1 [Dermatophagoides farinae]|uniref:Golgi transport 1B n=1 Tax=Dermatophagoides farinae TaxID=6954 RepID=A0A922L8X1_DERFA|nr:vesicle transport protein got1b-like protein [Dermatophagoides farinae]KAH9522057.1 golgi transport 1B [Dermatophagoides farinae]
MLSDTQKIGLGLSGFGIAFLMLGTLMLFDKGLLAVGNLLFISGLAFIIGLERTFWFFFQRHKWKASTSFFSGIIIVLFGWPIIGMILESYGFLLLFRGFIPATIAFLSRVPVVGFILNMPIIRTIVNALSSQTGRNNV